MIQNSATLPPLPHIDISSPEAARQSLRELRRWAIKALVCEESTDQIDDAVAYACCAIDAMRFPNAHKSEVMKQAAQEAIDKLKAMLADTAMSGR